jgi:hypothetical protein
MTIKYKSVYISFGEGRHCLVKLTFEKIHGKTRSIKYSPDYGSDANALRYCAMMLMAGTPCDTE